MPPRTQLPAPDQPLLGFLANDEWDALIARVSALVECMEALPEGETRSNVFALLDGIDAIHREALRRLVRLFKEGVLEQVVSDPAIHTLMELYDLLPPAAGPALAVPEAAAPGQSRFAVIPIRALPAGSGVPPRYPHWLPVPVPAAGLAPGQLCAVRVDGLPLLIARRAQRWFALDAVCPVDGSPMDGATLDGYTLSCPRHPGCHYDVRDGKRLGGGAAVGCRPVKLDPEGRLLVGLDMDFEPELPSF